MIEIKTIELRDVGTFIPAAAIRVAHDRDGTRSDALIARAGFFNSCGVGLMRLDELGRGCWDPFAWGDRTMTAAHVWLRDHYDELTDGQVVDVRHILGETSEPCQSELPLPPHERCGHSACSQHYIDTGRSECVQIDEEDV